MQEIIIKANEAGQRLDKMLGKYLNQAPTGFIYKMLRKKNIVLNGKKATGNEKLCAGDSVKLFLADETIEKFSKLVVQKTDGTRLDIVYEDAHILLINKPVGMLSQKAEAGDVSLVEHVISYLMEHQRLSEEELRTFRPGICNRLDRNTSGLVVAGKSLFGLQKMSELIQSRMLRKFYRCLVAGEVKGASHIDGYLLKDEKSNKVVVLKDEYPNAQRIETKYQPIWSNGKFTLLEVHLITGRSHQIRAHLASIGHPIVGDYKYGDGKINRYFAEKYQLKSQFLHAYRLEMPEMDGELAYLSGKQFVAELPKLFVRILKEEE